MCVFIFKQLWGPPNWQFHIGASIPFQFGGPCQFEGRCRIVRSINRKEIPSHGLLRPLKVAFIVCLTTWPWMQFQGPKIDTYMYTDKHIVFVLNYMKEILHKVQWGLLKLAWWIVWDSETEQLKWGLTWNKNASSLASEKILAPQGVTREQWRWLPKFLHVCSDVTFITLTLRRVQGMDTKVKYLYVVVETPQIDIQTYMLS